MVIDEFPHLVKVSPALPSVLQAALDLRRRKRGSPIRLILCGSALTSMGGLPAGNAPLRGRAGCEGHVERLRRVRDLLAARGHDTRSTRLACYSAAGFTADLLAAEGDELMLVTPERLYA